jgi:hypothetical protein
VEGIGVLLFIVMIVLSLIEQASKAGKQRQGQGPPQRRPLPRSPGAELPRRPGQVPGRPGSARSDAEPAALPGAAADTRSASEMVAEDFWRELTGQPSRPRPASVPVPAPAEADSWDEEAIRAVEAPPPEVGRREGASASWEYRRPVVVHEEPVIVSLEEPLQDAAVRHAGYHKRLAAQASAPLRPPRAAESPLVRRLRQGEGLRESVILAEVFGRPRGLEEHSPDR